MTSESKWQKGSVIIAGLALILSVISLALQLWPGELTIFKPSGFCIVRGYTEPGFPSDFLLIPMVIDNTYSNARLVENMRLELKNVDTNSTITYTMAGTLPDAGAESRSSRYTSDFGIVAPANSSKIAWVVFHIENWWDETEPESFEFHFKGDQVWIAKFHYVVNGQNIPWANGDDFLRIPVYGTVDNLEYGGAYNSDCFSSET